MRITQSMLANNSLRHLSESYARLGKYQDQLSTGNKISRPSDDPVVAMKGMNYRSNLGQIEQYQRNLSEVYLWMDNSEAGIDQTNSALQRIRELVIQGKNGTLSEDDKQAVSKEIEQMKLDIMSVANTKVSGRYIFNGTDVDIAPVKNDPVLGIQVSINTEPYQVEISNGVRLTANVNAQNIFSQGLFDTIQSIEDTLKGTGTGDLDQLLGDLDGHLETLNAERSELGARYNRLEMVESRIGQQEVMANKILSDNEDVDIERVITDLMVQESVHRAALGVGSRIIQPTLLDFLR
ncbi:flagellar hook-associated protein 3 FlgL [Bacillus oleivorans]|uniref:Flagellar hook-associated protein 3 FlgL n=1 Tax=Bacillus oleivorans TaxID=1448271 RepID=A0A285CZE7_9BACI|nr:flagellar hook-associated protein FlgL [Bacillus oleivorans]SNX72922.1 flagellar hook-associated protein 3 FlgL [Bacillus oleivorans]